jgi:hypothetical protein
MPSKTERKRHAKVVANAITAANNQRQKDAPPPQTHTPGSPNPYDAEIIRLPHRSLGLLRVSNSSRQTVSKVITPELQEQYNSGKFKRIKANRFAAHSDPWIRQRHPQLSSSFS